MAYLRSVDMPFLFQLQFTAITFFWLLFCVALGIGYAFLLYKPQQLKSSYNKVLFALRSLTVALIAFLLFAPMIKFTGQAVERPLIILAQDNSASVSISQPANFNIAKYTQQIKELEKELSKEYEVKSFTFGTSVKQGLQPDYTETLTDINSVFKYINSHYSNRNIGAVILASDGIYNQGGSPEFEAKNLKSPLYTFALGDTIPKKDLLISNVNYNNIVYLGNDFQVEINIEAFQSKGFKSRLTVSDVSGPVFSKEISINSNEYRIAVPLTLSAKKKGMQRYNVSVTPINGEISKQNNSQTFFVEVLDGKSNVFILANSPHPDISAIKQSIELSKSYTVKSALISDFKPSDIEDAGLLILHQLPSSTANIKSVLQLAEQKPILFILGAQTDLPAFSVSQNLLTIVSSGLSEETVAKTNPAFYDFTISDKTLKGIQDFAPLISPFGNYTIKTQSSVLFSQQIGKLATDKPLLIFSKDAERKVAVLTGEGIWRWRLEDFKETGTHQAIDELVAKVIQFMVSKDDRRKFRVYSSKNSFDESEHIILNAELYTDSYELINTPDVSITITNGKKSYPFIFSKSGNGYILDAGILPSGEYSYTATTQLGKTKHSASGKFAIISQQTEYRQTTANHQLLYNLSALNSGELIYPGELNKIPEKIKNNELVKTILYEDKRYEELIDFKFLFGLIVFFLAAEWFLRKRSGLV